MNYLITGFPGMGKSAIAAELKRRGHTAFDPQSMQAYMHLQNRQTGAHIAAPASIPRFWYDTVGMFNWDPVKIGNLLDSRNDVFICSLAHNQANFYDQFRLIFVLTLDDVELERRLLERPGHTIGKASSELADIMTFHKHFEQSLLEHKAIAINVSKAIPEVVDEILGYANGLPSKMA